MRNEQYYTNEACDEGIVNKVSDKTKRCTEQRTACKDQSLRPKCILWNLMRERLLAKWEILISRMGSKVFV